jgi:hypothetical protein
MNSYEEVSRFFQLLYPAECKITFQTFSKTDPTVNAKILHGSLDQHWSTLRDLNSAGSGVYAMVNTGNGTGRNNGSVVSINNLLLDLDGSSVEPVLTCPVRPHVILATSDGRYQGRWKIEPIAITDDTRDENQTLFKRVQIGLAERFDGDPSVCDLARVARVPEFINYNHENPFLVQTLQVNDSPVLSIQELSKILDLNLQNLYDRKEFRKKTIVDLVSNEPIYRGTRNVTLFFICRSMAYQGLLDGDLLDAAFEINLNRCIPPLDPAEVRGIVYSVSGYWHAHSMSLETCLSRILKANPDLITHKGCFYRYDMKIRGYRFVPTVAFHNEIFQMTHRTAGRDFIDEVMDELCGKVHKGLPLHTPEAEFIEEFIMDGGKVSMEEVRRVYQRWCKKRGVSPLRKGLGKEIQLRKGVELKRIKTNGINYYGFQGISLKK